MKALPVIIGIVIILTLVSLPGAAMISKADLLASYTNLPQGTYDYSDDIPSCGDCTPEPWGKGTVTPTPTPTPVPYDSADDSDCSECRDPGVHCDPPSISIFPPTPTVEGSMKVTERHVPQLPPYIPSWMTPLFF